MTNRKKIPGLTGLLLLGWLVIGVPLACDKPGSDRNSSRDQAAESQKASPDEGQTQAAQNNSSPNPAPAEEKKKSPAQYDQYFTLWDQLVKENTSPGQKNKITYNKVNYGKINQDQRFKKIWQWLESVPVPEKYGRKFAFWINAYNMYVIRLIHDSGTPASILTLDGGKAFKKKYYSVAGQKRSLDGMEKGIVAYMGNPNYHFALVCAAISCPDLAPRAYTAKNYAWLMKKRARLFFQNSTKGLRLNKDEKIVYLSKLGEWYNPHFKKWGGFREYGATFFKDQPEKQKAILNFEVKYMDYDWALNN